MITRKDEFGIVDLGATLDLVPRQFRLITGMDLFETRLGTSTIAQIERVDEVVTDIPARRRGGERNYVGSERAQVKNLNIPFFLWTKASLPQMFRTSVVTSPLMLRKLFRT